MSQILKMSLAKAQSFCVLLTPLTYIRVGQARQEKPLRSWRLCERKCFFHALSDIVPKDPILPIYRQGATLEENHKHWFRAKFFQQYRLFFRFHSESKIIVFSWVNDDKNKRAYGSKSDAYRVFEKMLNSGHPPDSWDPLLQEAKCDLDRLNKIAKRNY